MNSTKIAMLQLMSGNTTEENLHIGLRACEKAAEMGADIAVFPEMWSCGYNIPEDIRELMALSVPRDGEFVNAFGEAAQRLGIAVAVTYLERFEPLPRNTVTLFERTGRRVLDYSKVHTCDFGDEKRLTAGDDFYTAELDTAGGSINVGAMICYDREFPESARILMLKGAEVILVPNACPMEINRISQLRGRAYENMTGIVTVNYPLGKPDCNGHSTAFDGIAYPPDGSGSRDTLVIEAGEREGIYIADLPIDDIREYCRSEVHGNAYRRPGKYGLLLSEERREPFIRADRRE